ncbi:hypothetical protein ACHAXR_001474, partial [Thalassiosira sp. AJA248-18]
MQRFITAFHQKVGNLKGETPSQDDPDPGGEDKLNKRMTASNDELLVQEILSRLVNMDSGEDGRCALFKEREITPIDHIHQSETWDCGLTCVQMILPWLRQNNVENLLQRPHISEDVRSSTNVKDQENCEKDWMINFVATKSVWTIDLVVLLEHILSTNKKKINIATDNREGRCVDRTRCVLGCQKQDCPHQLDSFSFPPLSSWSYLFCSTKFGVDESYNDLGYYKDAFSSDEQRVKKMFDIAEKQNLPLLQISHLSLEVLADIVARKGVVAIVLVDNRILRNNVSDASSYSGHYVVLCGISNEKNDIHYARINSPEDYDARHNFCMVVKNPGVWKQSEYVTPVRFEKAWRATGTDEDVIFLAKLDQ